MSRANTTTTSSFRCGNCGKPVPADAPGTHHRNHCPACLWSIHVDHAPGDRRSRCRGQMEPVGVEVRRNGEWALIHRCRRCGVLKTNRIAGDDDEHQLLKMALRPIHNLPFTLE